MGVNCMHSSPVNNILLEGVPKFPKDFAHNVPNVIISMPLFSLCKRLLLVLGNHSKDQKGEWKERERTRCSYLSSPHPLSQTDRPVTLAADCWLWG